MITEKTFATNFGGFWQELLPMLEQYIRLSNLRAERFAPPMKSDLDPASRGLVNELGFRIFAAMPQHGKSASELPEDIVQSCVDAALRHIRTMRQFSRRPVPPPTPAHLQEARHLAAILGTFFFGERHYSEVIIAPTFRGCGWLESCDGDVLGSETLFEVKAGDRGFRGVDVRQVLAYCALNFADKQHSIGRVCLVNPRLGRWFEEDVDALCREAGGASAVEVLSDIVEYVSSWSGPETLT